MKDEDVTCTLFIKDKRETSNTGTGTWDTPKQKLNPTDSVTSDGTKEERAKDYVPDWENSKIIYATDQTGEKRLFINGEEWVKKPK